MESANKKAIALENAKRLQEWKRQNQPKKPDLSILSLGIDQERVPSDEEEKEQKHHPAAAKRPSSPNSATTYGYTFKLPKFDASVYIQFIDRLIFGSCRKDAIMQPIPPAVGQLKFCIARNKSIINKLTPSYYLYLEKNNGGKILILYGKRMAFKK